jgi:hypothetical protein
MLRVLVNGLEDGAVAALAQLADNVEDLKICISSVVDPE